MNRKIIALSIALVALTTTFATAQPSADKPQNVIEVTASAQKMVVPNKIQVTLTISQNPSKGKVELSVLESRVISVVNGLGLDASKCMKVTNQSSNYNRKTTVFGFKTYLITLSNQEQTTELFSGLSQNEIAGARITNITHTDIDSLQLEVKAQAMINAKATAEQVAGAVGQKISEAIYINVMNYGPVSYNSPMRLSKANSSMMNDSAEGEAADIEFQEIKIEQSVSAKFLLLGK